MAKNRYILTGFCILSILLSLSGCSPAEENAPANGLVILAGTHNNSERIDMGSMLETKIDDALSGFGTVRILVVDGNPEVLMDDDGHPIGYAANSYLQQQKKLKRDNPEIWRSRHRDRVEALLDSIASLSPDDPEVDTLSAIKDASDLLHGMLVEQDQNTTLELVIFDTGLCTAGALNFLQNETLDLLFREERLRSEEIQPLIQALQDQAELPDLTGIRVVWYGLGKVAGNQTLSNLNVENLRSIWTAILQSAGAIPFDSDPASGKYFSSVPSYSETSYAQPVTKVINWNREEKILEESLGGFEKNSSRFLDEKAAVSALTPIADNLKNYPSMELLLVGTTSDPERHGGDVQLSKERAEAVRKKLVQLGVTDAQIATVGWGANEPFYDGREWEGGRYVEEIAAGNRSVLIMSKNSNLASRVLQGPR